MQCYYADIAFIIYIATLRGLRFHRFTMGNSNACVRMNTAAESGFGQVGSSASFCKGFWRDGR